VSTGTHTLGIQKVADGHWVGTVGDVRCLEDLLHVGLGLDAHVFLAKRGGLLLNVGMLLSRLSERVSSPDASDATTASMAYQLLRQRHLLQRHAVHTSSGAADRGREDHRRLHVGGLLGELDG
jgi:hypothetical protein